MASSYERFRTELETIINIHSMEAKSNTPDYILAFYLIGCLKIFDETINARDKHKGIKDESN